MTDEAAGQSRLMDVVLLPIQGGKTTRLLDWMRAAPSDEWRVGVFHSLEEQHRQIRAAHDRGEYPGVFESWQFVSMEEVLDTDGSLLSGVRLRPGRIVLGIDNLDLVLPSLIDSGFDIGMVTMTGAVPE